MFGKEESIPASVSTFKESNKKKKPKKCSSRGTQIWLIVSRWFMSFFSFFVSSVFLSFFFFFFGSGYNMKGESHCWAWTCCSYVFCGGGCCCSFLFKPEFSKKKLRTRLFSRKFLFPKNVFKSDRQVVRQEYIFVKRQSSLRKKDRVGLRSHSFVYLRNEECMLAAWRFCLWLVVYLHICEYFWFHTSGFVKKIQSGI